MAIDTYTLALFIFGIVMIIEAAINKFTTYNKLIFKFLITIGVVSILASLVIYII